MTMNFYPAIDLKDGKCVRLYQGDMGKATVFSESPASQAKAFEDEGAGWLHIVDLNGAFEGKPINFEVVKDIIASVNLKTQLGGGIRDIETIRNWLEAGIKRVILGTAAVKNPELVEEACKDFPDQIVVGIDAWEGKVATEGWAEKSELGVIELAKKFEDCGVAAIIYTDITKDGAMQGADFDGIKELAESVSIPVIASGGVSNLDDIRKLKELENFGVEGVISGRAIYEKAFTVKEAVDILG
jgi:phosphoribosylformimino-5-aminoimidazole carboxamide ribotide isomerase